MPERRLSGQGRSRHLGSSAIFDASSRGRARAALMPAATLSQLCSDPRGCGRSGAGAGATLSYSSSAPAAKSSQRLATCARKPLAYICLLYLDGFGAVVSYIIRGRQIIHGRLMAPVAPAVNWPLNKPPPVSLKGFYLRTGPVRSSNMSMSSEVGEHLFICDSSLVISMFFPFPSLHLMDGHQPFSPSPPAFSQPVIPP